jgi:hypothetical protein
MIAYLACPYTHPEADVRNAREAEATKATAFLIKNLQVAVYSPITHGHRIADHLPSDLRTHSDFWLDQCLPILRKCACMYILQIPGWEKSSGIAKELVVADEYKLALFSLIPEGNSYKLRGFCNAER